MISLLLTCFIARASQLGTLSLFLLTYLLPDTSSSAQIIAMKVLKMSCNTLLYWLLALPLWPYLLLLSLLYLFVKSVVLKAWLGSDDFGLLLPRQEQLATSGDIFGFHNWKYGGIFGGLLLASSGERTRMLLNILQHTRQPSTSGPKCL